MLALPVFERRLGALRLADVHPAVRRAVVARHFRGAIGFPLIARGRDVGRKEIHHHDAVVLCHQAQDIVGHIARMVDDRARRGVGKHDRRLADRERRLHRFGRYVAQIDEHAEPVHFPNYFEPNGVRSVMRGRIGGRVRPIGCCSTWVNVM